jgi:DNA repair protein Swi5/Sae3
VFWTTRLPATETNGRATDAAAAVQKHIKLLHEYNEIRDVALNFAGKIAENERCRTIDVLREYDMDETD